MAKRAKTYSWRGFAGDLTLNQKKQAIGHRVYHLYILPSLRAIQPPGNPPTRTPKPQQHSVDGQIEQGRYVRLMARPKRLFTRLLEGQHQGDDDQGMQLAQAVVQRAAQAAGSAVAP